MSIDDDGRFTHECVVFSVQFIGKTAGFIVPLIVVLSLLVGLFAAGSYNNGATQVLQP